MLGEAVDRGDMFHLLRDAGLYGGDANEIGCQNGKGDEDPSKDVAGAISRGRMLWRRKLSHGKVYSRYGNGFCVSLGRSKDAVSALVVGVDCSFARWLLSSGSARDGRWAALTNVQNSHGVLLPGRSIPDTHCSQERSPLRFGRQLASQPPSSLATEVAADEKAEYFSLILTNALHDYGHTSRLLVQVTHCINTCIRGLDKRYASQTTSGRGLRDSHGSI
jgi:hypothetical protein